MLYDLFSSYARRNNTEGRVSELVERIADDYRQISGEELRYFFDVHDIPGMDDWLFTILEGLKDSQLFLLVLSPEYLKSKNCEREIVEYLKYESARAVSGEGVAPIYVVTIPGLEEPGFEKRAAWYPSVGRRQRCDLRAWFDAGRQALESQDVRARLDDLKRSLHTRLSRLRRIAGAQGNLPAYNPRFVGRETEMSRLHEAAGLGQLGVISVLHGIGGLGKTALAIQYAFAYADFYPGGRWLVLASSRHDLAAAIRTLDVDLGVEFTDDEKLDDTRAAKRILRELHKRAECGAAKRAGEPNPPQPRTLLILDNIDDARLLQPPHTDLLSGCSWLHVLATTRLGPEQLSPDDHRHRLLAVDELPKDDALRLIASYQPQGRFASDDERAAARDIVTLLEGFTLAVEVVAVHLAERGGRLTCAALRDRLKAEGLTGLENVAGKTTRGVPHVERLVTVTLAPTLAALSPPESLVLTLAALLPPDHVPLPWLRAVAAATFPDLGQDAPPGYDDPWLSLVNHLISLRLLQVVDLAADGRTPRLCRVHRLVQEVVKKTQPDDLAARERALLDHIRARALFLWEGWVHQQHRWELAPLTACADNWLDRDG
ncbi:MAG TPA: TIR domain-containing protein, partial [Opitutaceae bacterium]|nr:TIR domain-containing protein [Opitutaceae bacterium]